jgi:magnesium transporter
MKVLTIVASIFIPLGFITGLYGMNFDSEVSPYNMPELHWIDGYPMAIGMMVTMVSLMLFAFWKHGWLNR